MPYDTSHGKGLMRSATLCISAGGGITIVSLSYIHGKEKSAIGCFDELGEESETQISTSYSN